MATTLTNLIQEFTNIADYNVFIKRWGHGPISDVNTVTPRGGAFPVQWVIPQTVELGENGVVYSVRILIFDADRSDDSQRLNIMSDCLQIINDVVKVFRNGGSDDSYEVTNIPIATPFEQEFVDYCVGWYVDLDISTDSMNSPCDTPI